MENLPRSCRAILFLLVIRFSHSYWPSYINKTLLQYVLQHELQVNNSFGQPLHTARDGANISFHSHVLETCNVTVKNRSAYIFQQILKKHRPHFVQFRIKFYYKYSINKTTDVFQPGRWYWTFGLMSKPYQFLSWDIRYGLFTFGLLDFKTSLVPTVFMKVKGTCNLTIGTKETSKLITKALIPLINVESPSHLPQQYQENYFCYLSVNENVRNTFAYIASIYLLYPTIYIDYKCCLLKYNFTNEKYTDYCSKEITHVHQWTYVLTFNIILGIMIIAFSPLPLFRLLAWLGESDVTVDDEHRFEPRNDLIVNNEERKEEEWLFANGKHPLTLFDVISFRGIGLDKKWPVFVSRLRRFICLMLTPSLIYIQMLIDSRGVGVWEKYDKITMKDFVDVGSPVDFMSLLGDASNRYKVFVPALGGPVVITVIYFALGFLYLVCPLSLKCIVDNGLPNSCVFYERLSSNVYNEWRNSHHRLILSPLFLGLNEIL